MNFESKFPAAKPGDRISADVLCSVWPREACRVCDTITAFVKEVPSGQVPVCSEACAAVRFAIDCLPCPEGCDEPWCPEHQQHYADCPCPGPNSEDYDVR